MKAKKYIKKALIYAFRRSKKLRSVIHKLNKIANDSVSTSAPVSAGKDIFTSQAMYEGYSNSYYNFLLSTKAERENQLKKIFYGNCKYYLDLENPVTFNQKVQWLKLNYHDDRISRCVDKAEFKHYIAEQLGEGYTVEMYGSWDHENKIDFDSLPNRFVLKSNVQSDSRHILFVKDKNTVDKDKLKTVLSSWLLRKNNLCSSFCNAYHSVTPQIIAEEYLEPSSGSITDYKFYCYHGECRHFLVCKDRGSRTKYINYDMNMNCIKPSPNSYVTNEKYVRDEQFEKMLAIAHQLAKPFPLVRVDFYDVDGKLYVGEMTFYPGGGYNTYTREWDEKFGSYLTLPQANVVYEK